MNTLSVSLALVTLLFFPSPLLAKPRPSPSPTSAQSGTASWYGAESGRKTASGERFHPGGLTAAHRKLPFGTKVRVTHVKSGKSTVVRINDRGPFIKGRIIDVSQGAATQLGMLSSGTAQVRLEVIPGDDF